MIYNPSDESIDRLFIMDFRIGLLVQYWDIVLTFTNSRNCIITLVSAERLWTSILHCVLRSYHMTSYIHPKMCGLLSNA